MSLHVQCACGNAIDCEHLEMVVTLPCPFCNRELTVEFLDATRQRRRIILTVAEGPRFTGQRYVVPVGEQLILGAGGQSWLPLPQGEVAERHCRLHVDPRGLVNISDLDSPHGTWIDTQRVVQGVLKAGQSLRLGYYRLEVNVESVAPPDQAPVRDAIGGYQMPAAPLPVMHAVVPHSVSGWIIGRRFTLIRGGLLAYAWIGGL
ncbi:MAG: FHA domain-containing protein, partial [Phycisphaerae bacterium]